MNNAVHLKRERNSAVELLRIVAMMFIVMSHCSVYGDFPTVSSKFPFNSYFLDWISLGNVGVDLFLMISGYFLSAKEFRIQSIIKLLAQVLFFSYLCLAVSCLAGNAVSKWTIIRAVFPTITSVYWFFSAYMVLLLLSPFINIFVKNASGKQLFSCLSIMMALWSILPTITDITMYGADLPQFVMFYLLGAYLKKYPDNVLRVPKFRRWLIVCSAVLLFASSAILRSLNDHVLTSYIFERKYYGRTSVFVVGLAIGMFSTAVYHKPWSNKFVNTIASCTFGVYLFHDNPLIRAMLWPVWVNNTPFYDSQVLIPRVLLSVVIVYVGCTLIELLRQKFFVKPLEYLLEKVYGFCSRILKRGAIALQTMHEHE